MMLASADPVDHVVAHPLFRVSESNLRPADMDVIPLLNINFGPSEFYFTNHLLMALVAAGLCLIVFFAMGRSYATPGAALQAPKGWRNLIEAIMQFIRNDVARPVLLERTDRFVPFLWTLFFFILFCNLLGMIPLADIVKLISGGRLLHIGGTATGNLAITGGLAICAFFAIHVSGVVEVFKQLKAGVYGHHEHGEHEDHEGPAAHPAGKPAPVAAVLSIPLYIWNFAPHVFRPTPGMGVVGATLLWTVDILMWAMLFVLECIGAVIKPFALMIRLFANMIAGHIVLASIILLVPALSSAVSTWVAGTAGVFGGAALSLLEVFVAFLQAYIFVFLTTLFISAAVAPEH